MKKVKKEGKSGLSLRCQDKPRNTYHALHSLEHWDGKPVTPAQQCLNPVWQTVLYTAGNKSMNITSIGITKIHGNIHLDLKWDKKEQYVNGDGHQIGKFGRGSLQVSDIQIEE